MNLTADEVQLLEILSQPRLLRSSSEGKIFCKLNNKNRIEIVGASGVNLSVLDDFDESNKNFEEITDDKERAEAYRDLAKQLDSIIKLEKKDNLKLLSEKVKFIKNQSAQIETLETELKLYREQLLNTKDLVNQLSDEKIAQNTSINQLEQEIENLNSQIEKLRNLFEGFDLELLAENIRKIAEEYHPEPTDENLNETIDNLATDINNIKPVVSEARNFFQKLIMQVEAKDVINGIPMLSDAKHLDGFMNACDMYNELVDQAQRPTVLKIIKAKISGEALAKAGPFTAEMNTWALLKKQLKDKIKKPISFEYAQEDLNQSFQKVGESVEDYGNRMRLKLKKLNEASKSLTENQNEMQILHKTNERQAISKFEQNIRDPTIKVLVSAAGKLTLDDCITFAMQKELTEKNKNIKACKICGLNNHDETTCRGRKQNDSRPKAGHGKYNDGQHNRDFNKNYDRKNGSNSSKNNERPSTSGYSQSNNQRNRNFNRPKNGNNGNEKSNENQKNVKVVNESENSDMTTVKEALKETQNPKN